jgi:drug/metabolite transporter (DMT)-like permease
MNYFALITAIMWGCAYACTEQIVKYIDVKTYMTISCFFSFVIFLSFGVGDGSLVKDASSSRIPIFFIVAGCVSSLLATYFSVNAVKYSNATQASILEISYPIFVIIFTFMITGKHHLTLNTLFGGLLIGAGTLIVLRK